MRCAARDVVEQLRATVHHGYDRVDAAVIIEIGECYSTMHGSPLKIRSGRGRYIFESLAPKVAEDSIRQNGIGPRVAIRLREMGKREEQILPAIVIEIVHPQTPAGQLLRAHH